MKERVKGHSEAKQRCSRREIWYVKSMLIDTREMVETLHEWTEAQIWIRKDATDMLETLRDCCRRNRHVRDTYGLLQTQQTC